MSNARTFILILSLCLLAACGDEASVSTDGDEATPTTPQGDYWSTAVTENGEPKALVEGTRLSFSFGDNEVWVSAGCNSMGGSFAMTDEGVLTVTDTMMTEMGCDGPRHAQDDFVSAFLASSPTLAMGENTITLSNDTVTIELLDRKVADPDRPIIGTEWEVTGFFDASVATSLATENKAWIRFVDQSTAHGFDGCAEFTMNVEVNDGSTGGPIGEGADGELQFGGTLAEPPVDCVDAPYAARVGSCCLTSVHFGADVATGFIHPALDRADRSVHLGCNLVVGHAELTNPKSGCLIGRELLDGIEQIDSHAAEHTRSVGRNISRHASVIGSHQPSRLLTLHSIEPTNFVEGHRC